MSDEPDPDLQKAIYALQVLRQARFFAQRNSGKNGSASGVCDSQHRVTDPRNRGNSASCLGCNFRVGECYRERNVRSAQSLESSAQSYRELNRIAEVRWRCLTLGKWGDFFSRTYGRFWFG
jgi:hypothetical protein